MTKTVFLTGFSAALPPHCRPQRESFEWLAQAHARAAVTESRREDTLEKWQARMVRRLHRYSCSEEHIGWRRSEVGDFMHMDWQRMEIFNLSENPRGRGLGERNAFFAQAANRAVETLFTGDSDPPTDLLHVSCTGYVSPSAVQRLIELKHWNGRTQPVQVYQMGCYAALPALRIASGLLNNHREDGLARADIVHTEICTLHFNPSDHSPEQLVIQTLFADGHIRYSVRPLSRPELATRDGGLEVLALREEMLPDSLDDMTWTLSEWGFRMTLSRDVPGKIAGCLPRFLLRLFLDAGMSYDQRNEHTVFAIHPGGPRILDSIEDLLCLRAGQLRLSRRVLFERGNMSSATLPHIWMAVVSDEGIKRGSLIVSLAFGPGLTIAGALFRKC